MPPKVSKKPVKEEVAESAEVEEYKKLTADADKLHKLSKKEEQDFNEFQQQREKLNYFWIVEKKKLEDKRVELRNKERELQDLEEKHQVEIKIYKQRLKHLLYEHQNEITKRKTEAEEALKIAQDDDREGESDMKEDRRALNINLKEIEFTHDEHIRSLKREQDQKVTFLRHEFERRAAEVQRMFDARMKKTRETLDKRRKEEITSIEAKKQAMIALLMNEHQKTFNDIKNYYSDITHNNLDTIKSLKEEVKEAEIRERKEQIELHEKKIEHQHLSLPLKEKQKEVIKLRADVKQYSEEKAEMRKVKAALNLIEGSQMNVSWEYETLLQRLEDLKREKIELEMHLRASIFEVKQKSAFRGMLLEKKLLALQRVQEEREAQLNEVITRANLEPTVLNQVKGHVDDILMRKNAEARTMQAEVARLQALHESLFTFVNQKLAEYGLTMTELGYEPVKPSPKFLNNLSNTLKLTNGPETVTDPN